MADPEALISASADPRSVAVLVTDVAGFTVFVQSLGDDRARHLLREHDGVLCSCFRRYGGLCVNHTGDGFVAGFVSPSAAAQCALEIQRRISEHASLRAMEVRLRIGVDHGHVLVEEGRLFGLSVITTFRLCARTLPGQIQVTERFAQLAVGPGFHYGKPDYMRLKGIEQPTAVCELTASRSSLSHVPQIQRIPESYRCNL